MSRYEQPVYDVVATTPGYEIRRYQPFLVAETTVRGAFDAGGNIAFRRLAGFIFGQNDRAARMNMTVPVTQQADGHDSYRYRFVMERTYSVDTLPRPIDSTVNIARVAAGHYAAISYRGGRNEARFRRFEARLLDALARDGVAVLDVPALAVHSGPTTPPPLRRNEVLVPVAWQAVDGGARAHG